MNSFLAFSDGVWGKPLFGIQRAVSPTNFSLEQKNHPLRGEAAGLIREAGNKKQWADALQPRGQLKPAALPASLTYYTVTYDCGKNVSCFRQNGAYS